MKFRIRKTSSWDEPTTPPVKGAVLEKVEQFKYPVWCIEVKWAKEIIALCKEADSPIIVTPRELPELEIYDDYRE